MKNLFLLFLLLPACLKAQQEHLIIKGTTGAFYVTHAAAPKENFYSIGRMFNISPKEIAPFNNMILENGLSIGTALKVPLIAGNFMQEGTVEKDEAAVPLYYKAETDESLSQVSARYNKVSVASLKAWNKTSADKVSAGNQIIVGYLKVNKELSPLAKIGNVIPVVKNEEEPVITAKEKIPVKKTAAAEVPPVTEKAKAVIIEEKRVGETITKEIPANTSNMIGGAFKPFYKNTGKQESGTAGVFKSLSGHSDGKYYCLHNSAPQGSVIKITNPATGKFVFAKVLDMMPDLKQNDELAVRLSNAAAEELGADMNDFECTINY